MNSSLLEKVTPINVLYRVQMVFQGRRFLMLLQTTGLGFCLVTIAVSSDSNGQQSGDGSQILISKLNLTR